jgi:hypothetical protein
MAKAKLEYDLTDHDDRMEFARATKSLDLALALWQFSYNSKKTLQWDIESNAEKNNLSQEAVNAQFETLNKVFDRFHEIMNEYDINLENLVV